MADVEGRPLRADSREPGIVANVAAVVGVLAYLIGSWIALVLTSMVAPVPLGWFVVGGALLVTLALVSWAWRAHRERLILLPLIGAAVWMAILAVGGWLFGWTG